MAVYETKFYLTNPVNDLDAAQKYLSDDDMAEYLRDEIDYNKDKCEDIGLYPEDIISIDWILSDEQSGKIVLKTKNELSSQALEFISEWVSGQNSDGLGEGFEQQPFAEIYDEDEWGDPDPDSYDMASFDWQTNKYKFKRVSESKNTLLSKIIEAGSEKEIRKIIEQSVKMISEEKPNYRVTFHDGPQGNKSYDIDIYAKDSDEAFKKAYKKFKDTFGDEPRYKGYTDATTSEIPTGPTDIGIEFSYIDHGRNDRKGTQYMVIRADSEKDAVDIYNKTFKGKKFYQPWPDKIDPNGNCTYSDIKHTYFV